ncbi:MAG: lipoyl(octanoyl) transferase LipB [bacterium]|nr:lipoyl(octanoyl) transferase LipB [bacterium]
MTEKSRKLSKQAEKPVSFVRYQKLGRISFDHALALQEDAIENFRSTGKGLPVIFSLEHDPVITCGRSTKEENLLLKSEEYEKRGIQVRKIDRGGDVTFHGPGQVVVYPILSLRDLNIRAGEYVRVLENSMIRTCAEYGVNASTKDSYPGCWTESGKIGAIGTAVKAGGITKHGLAFNVDVDLEYFKLIIPCGIKDSHVTRLSNLTERKVPFGAVETSIVKNICALLGLDLSDN